jgi:hypothetical protein
MYADFRQITALRLSHWQHTHILEPPDNYERTKRLLQAALGKPSREERAKLLLEERNVALGIFQLFEETLYQLSDAERVDQTRVEFLHDVLNYMTGSLLRNPRLLYLWSETGGCLCSDFELSTKQYYDENVKTTSETKFDIEGLFGNEIAW